MQLLEDAGAGVWSVAVGALFNAIVTRAPKPYGAFPPDMPPLACGCQGLPCALPQEAQRLCRQRALHPQHETISALPRILEAIIVDAHGLRQGTSSDAMMPGAVVARQPGGFQGEDGPDPPCTHGRQPWAKAWTLVAARPTPAYVLIDHDDLGQPQPAGMLGEGIWPPLALGVGADVMARRLADRDVGIPLEMARGNLGAQGDTPRSGHGGCRG